MPLIELMAYRVYRLPFRSVFVLMAIAVFLWAIFAATLGKKYPKSRKAAHAVLLLTAVFCILYSTLLRRTPNAEDRVVLMPFASLEAAKHMDEIYRSLVMNVLLFFPIGLFLPQLLPDKWKSWEKILVTVGAGLLFSVGIETLQYFLKLGDTETDDTITNALGTAIGTLHIVLADAFSKLAKKKKAE